MRDGGAAECRAPCSLLHPGRSAAVIIGFPQVPVGPYRRRQFNFTGASATTGPAGTVSNTKRRSAILTSCRSQRYRCELGITGNVIEEARPGPVNTVTGLPIPPEGSANVIVTRMRCPAGNMYDIGKSANCSSVGLFGVKGRASFFKNGCQGKPKTL